MEASNQNQIDYSAIPKPEVRIDNDWDPPRHVFFGKKDGNGKMEKEPVYAYQEYPRTVYAQVDGKIVADVVNNADELAALGPGWEKSPAVFGFIGAPSFEDHLRLRKSPAMVLADAQAAVVSKANAEAAWAASAEAVAKREADEATRRAAAEEALNQRIADAVAAALPSAVAAHLAGEEKRGPGRPKNS